MSFRQIWFQVHIYSQRTQLQKKQLFQFFQVKFKYLRRNWEPSHKIPTEQFVGCPTFLLYGKFHYNNYFSARNKRNERLVPGFRTRRYFDKRFLHKSYSSAVFVCCRDLIEGWVYFLGTTEDYIIIANVAGSLLIWISIESSTEHNRKSQSNPWNIG